MDGWIDELGDSKNVCNPQRLQPVTGRQVAHEHGNSESVYTQWHADRQDIRCGWHCIPNTALFITLITCATYVLWTLYKMRAYCPLSWLHLVPCCAVPPSDTTYHPISDHIIPYPIMTCHAVPFQTAPLRAISYHGIPCAVAYPTTAYHISRTLHNSLT